MRPKGPAHDVAPGAGRPALAPDDNKADQTDTAGEPACWAHLVCPSCGAVTSEGHLPDCELTTPL